MALINVPWGVGKVMFNWSIQNVRPDMVQPKGTLIENMQKEEKSHQPCNPEIYVPTQPSQNVRISFQ